MQKKLSFKSLPDKSGHFGDFGGKFVPETLIPALIELERAYREVKRKRDFKDSLKNLLIEYAGRPTPLYFAKNLSEKFGIKIYLKREDLCHTGAHKINIGKERVIAETGAGQHGVATATAAALLKLKCTIYIGSEDMKRQALNVFRMRLLGAEVKEVKQGTGTLKDAMNEAIRDWVTNVRKTHYLIGSVAGPHPYPMIVRDFQSVIGKEVKAQILKREKRLPDILLACIGGGSNSIGLFYPFLDERGVRCIGVEAGGLGVKTGVYGASLSFGRPGVIHGSMSYLLQTDDGQVKPAHSISAGLDYPGVGPELSYLKQKGRVEVYTVTDKEALDGFKLLTRAEGIIPALESAHAIACLNIMKVKKGEIYVINLSGRGDKDVYYIEQKHLSV